LISDESILVLDVGNFNTRAMLFDVVEGAYRFIAFAESPSTITLPIADVMVGVRQTIRLLEEKTGRTFLTDSGDILRSADATDGSDVDHVAAVLSAGPFRKTVVVGLLHEISVSSARKLAEMLYAEVADVLHINDPRSEDEQINQLAATSPDLFVVAGGTDDGARRALERLFEIVALGAYLSTDHPPLVLYAGNQALAAKAQEAFSSVASTVHVAPNVRPTLDDERLLPALTELAHTWASFQAEWLGGMNALQNWTNGLVLPTNYAQGRTVRLFGAIYDSPKGVVSVDVGGNSVSLQAAFKKKYHAKTLPYGSGDGLARVLKKTNLAHIMRWLPLDISKDTVRDYLANKSFYPGHIPVGKDALAIEQAIAREVLQLAVKSFVRDLPDGTLQLHPHLLPLAEPIFAGGAVFSSAPTPGQALLTLLDGLQPVGVTTLVLDDNDLLAAMGVLAELNPLVASQILETAAFTNLATVISPFGSVRAGLPLLRAKMTTQQGDEREVNLRQGTLEVLTLPPGLRATVELIPARGVNVGFGPGRKRKITVNGSLLGLVFDGRGRPLSLPEDPVRRRELMKKWLWALGG
jgi:hypothetical protein